MMKIIAVDNFARESVADRLIADNIANEVVGNIMVKALNSDCDVSASFYKLVPDDYKLWGGMEELV
jgi:hypothetical protein